VAIHAALGDPVRLALVDDLACCDRSPSELSERHHLATNLLAHHLDVLELAGLVERGPSAGDGRRRYVRLVPSALDALGTAVTEPPARILFLCSHNSARSQLAAALWISRTGLPDGSAGSIGDAGVDEFIEMTEELVEAMNGDDPVRFTQAGRRQMAGRTLRRDALRLALEGRTTLEEVLRVGTAMDD
jgi:DNA-binding MarR family transcriptional regulator